MEALILSAGLSSRLGRLTKDFHKSLLEINPGLKIIDNQLISLRKAGIRKIVIVVGYKSEKLINYAKSHYPDLNFRFVDNKIFASTNCLYSLWLSRQYLKDDLIYMTGDLVMDTNLISEMVKNGQDSIFSVNIENENNRDFCARAKEGIVSEVSINLRGNDVFPCLPLMRLSSASFNLWLDAADEMINKGLVNEYEMAALNKVLGQIKVSAYFSDRFCMEVDEKEDLFFLRDFQESYKLGEQ
tara:strand:+ start:72 stop:797 length:726 start_codon:yes stop_codon:yes gene_type:complete